MERPYSELTPEDFTLAADQLLRDAQALSGDALPWLMAEAKAQGLTWVEALEHAILQASVSLGYHAHERDGNAWAKPRPDVSS
jgi:hypothetical protein